MDIDVDDEDTIYKTIIIANLGGNAEDKALAKLVLVNDDTDDLQEKAIARKDAEEAEEGDKKKKKKRKNIDEIDDEEDYDLEDEEVMEQMKMDEAFDNESDSSSSGETPMSVYEFMKKLETLNPDLKSPVKYWNEA